MKPLGLETRQRALDFLPAEPLDVLILGGGIVGAGVARDAALRGLKVGLVEQHDFAFGTSSRSSRLLHGGLRYLAQGRIGLVHEASREKKIIHHIAPHLAMPLPFIFPAYRGNKHWRLWQLKVGVKSYDLLCGGRNFGKSTWLNTDEVMCKVPALRTDDLNGAVRYYDGFTNDARLTLDTLRSAAKAGATLVNYCRFKDATRADDPQNPLPPALSPSDSPRCRAVAAGGERENRPPSQREPVIGGRRTITAISGEEQRLFPLPLRGGAGQGEGECPAECAGELRLLTPGGPEFVGALWECEIEDRLAGRKFTVRARAVVNATGPWAGGLPHSRVKLRLTKGIHLVVERAKVPVPETVVMTEGKRILFAIPWGGRTILGTTDTDYNGPLDAVNAAAADIAYLLQITNQFFPDAKLTAQDVLSTWAGLRPLLAEASGRPSDLSRSHQITHPEPGWWDVAGGKLTTYRLMAEQVVDGIVKSFRASNTMTREVTGCRTASEPLLPPAEVNAVSGILPPDFSRRAVEHYVAGEWAIHLDDVMVRRTSWHYYFPDAAQKAGQVADWMGELLGWTNEHHAAELQRYQAMTHCQPGETTSSSAATQRQNDRQTLPMV